MIRSSRANDTHHWASLSGAAMQHRREKKKADVVEYPQAFDHVGLLVNEPLGLAEVPFI
jgi:hypothetical protein